MQSILTEFAYGNISPEVQPVKHNSRYADAMRVLAGDEEELSKRLCGEDKETLKKLISAQCEVNELTAIASLIYGFKLGLLMTAEAFFTSDELIVGNGG